MPRGLAPTRGRGCAAATPYTTAIHAIVLPTNKVLYISQPKGIPGELEEVNGGNARMSPVTGNER